MKLMQHITNAMKPIIRISGYIASVALVAIVVVTTLDVILRYFFNRPILGTIEITEYLMIVLSFLAIATCGWDGGHVTVDLLVSKMKKKLRTVFEIFGYLLCLVVYVPMTLVFIPEAKDVLRMGEESEVLGIPAFPFYVVVIFGCGLLTIVLFIELFKSIKKLKEK